MKLSDFLSGITFVVFGIVIIGYGLALPPMPGELPLEVGVLQLVDHERVERSRVGKTLHGQRVLIEPGDGGEMIWCDASSVRRTRSASASISARGLAKR